VLSAIVATAAGHIGIAAAYLCAYLILRIGLAWTTGVWALGDLATPRRLWLVPLRDAISFAVWVGGFFFNKITWRGLAYRVKRGLLFPMPIAMPRTAPDGHPVRTAMEALGKSDS
jgi:ceramide glucosyltransferase